MNQFLSNGDLSKATQASHALEPSGLPTKSGQQSKRDRWLVDLGIELFDYTNNRYAAQCLQTLLSHPQNTYELIIRVQDILKSFIDSGLSQTRWPYAKIDLHEVMDFLTQYPAKPISPSRKFWLQLNSRGWMRVESRLLQASKLMQALHTNYFKNLSLNKFPASYQPDLISMTDLLSSFDLTGMHTQIVDSGKVKLQRLVVFHNLIVEKISDGSLQTFWRRLFQFEAYLAISIGITKHKFTFPQMLRTDGSLKIHGLYHPGVASAVKNDVLAASNVLVLSGPNMSGKSTLLKALSTCVYFSHLGLAIPAEDGQIPVFEYLFNAIEKDDDITRGYSHFMNEIVQVKEVVEKAASGARCFAVFDEIFTSTNYEDSLQITSLTLNGLVRFPSSLFCVSTHLEALANNEPVKSGIVDTLYLDSHIRDGIPSFSYMLKKGWSTLKFGEALFELSGLKNLLQSQIASKKRIDLEGGLPEQR